MPGIEALAANAHGLLHSSRMGKSGGSGTGGGIYILPYFFAETSQQPEHMRVIWPEDGTAASPIYLLAKRSARPRLDALLDFFTRGFGEDPQRALVPAHWAAPSRTACPPRRASDGWAGTSSGTTISRWCATSSTPPSAAWSRRRRATRDRGRAALVRQDLAADPGPAPS